MKLRSLISALFMVSTAVLHAQEEVAVSESSNQTDANGMDASDEPKIKNSKMCCRDLVDLFDPMKELDAKYHASYSAPLTVDLKCDRQLDLRLSFIYWNVNQEYMDVAYVPPITSGTGLAPTPGAVAYQNFEYSPGFKAGLGYNSGYDNWKLAAEYTWLYQTTSQTVSVPSGTQPGWYGNNWFTGYATPPGSNTSASNPNLLSPTAGLTATTDNLGRSSPTVTSKWKMDMNMLDLVAGRPYYQGRCLSFVPQGGLRFLWINQDLTVTLPSVQVRTAAVAGDAASSASSINSSDSWAVGPVGSVLSRWLIGKGFRFEGKMGASLLYTRYTNVNHSQHNPTIPPSGNSLGYVTSAAPSMGALRPTMDMGLGLGWAAYSSCHKYFLDLAIRYDFNIFWEQNVMREWVSNLQGSANPAGDLRMHGLTIDTMLRF